MTAAILGIEQGCLKIRCDDSGLDEARSLDVGTRARFEGWAEEYRRALRKERNTVELLALGRELFAWLDGTAAWLTRLRCDARPPLLLEIAVPLRPSPLELAFLEAPWELLADAAGYLAADPSLVFSPVRRLGAATRPEAASEHRLSLVFMGAAPEGAVSLEYEGEESAILDATAGIGLDLVVEESGWLPALVDVMVAERPVDVLHLSCHGLNEGGPHLLLEDELGQRAPATVDDLASALGDNLPRRLLFLSACLSADRPRSGDLVGSFAATMVQRGCPAALGWGGSVKDRDAMHFATELFTRLTRKESLEGATARARHALLLPPPGALNQTPASDWHLARLYLGMKGGGAFIQGNRARRRLAADHGHREFLDRRNETILVTSAREFVGRRRPLQRILRALRTPGGAGVVIHGVGGHGKSSLAARVAHRLVDHTPVVVTRFDAIALLDAIERAAVLQEVSEIIKEHRDIVRTDPARLVIALRMILEGPCRELQRDARGRVTAKPLLLVLDNFEDSLRPTALGFHTVEPSLLETMRAVVRAFDDADTTSGLLITSRYDFALPDRDGRDLARKIVHEALGPMSLSESEKQAFARQRAHPESMAVERERARSCIRIARGNPRLQNLLFLCAAETPTTCDAMLGQMARHLAYGREPDDEALRDFLENLALDALIALLSPGEKALLRASTLFSIPVPLSVLAKLGGAVGAAVTEAAGARLVALGLWEKIAKADAPEALVNALVRPRLAPLDDEERRALAAAVVGILFNRWGGEDESRRSFAMSLELLQLGMASGYLRAVAATGAATVRGLYQRQELRAAASLGIAAIEALDAAAEPVSLWLFKETGEACMSIGNVSALRRCLDRALELVSARRSEGKTVDDEVHAAIVVAHGRRLNAEGSPDAALRAYEEALELLQDARFHRERAGTRGEIARLRAQKGEVDAALALHHEELVVYEELGDRRSRAVTLGEIARLRTQKGDVDAALALHHEALLVHEELGDRRLRAITLGDIARLRTQKGEIDAAFALHDEALLVHEKLGNRRSRAITLGDIALLRAQKGEDAAALTLHHEALQVYEELGDPRERAITLGDIARLRAQQGEVDAALALHHEALQVYEELGDRRERAGTLGEIARLRAQRGEVDAALALHHEELQVYEELEDRRSRAIALGDIARLGSQKGEVDAALALHREALQICEELGDRRSRAISLGEIARLQAQQGDVDAALSLHHEELVVYEELGDRRARAITLGDIAHLRMQKGEVDAALSLHHEALRVHEELGDRRARAVTLGDIARLRSQKGEVDAALALHHEALQVYEELGDRRLRAVTLGDIARLRAQKGEVDASMALYHEALQANEELSDPDGVANVRWSMGRIAFHQGDVTAAFEHLSASYITCVKLGRLDAISIVGVDLAKVLLATGYKVEAIPILTRSRDGFLRLNKFGRAQQTQTLIDSAGDIS